MDTWLLFNIGRLYTMRTAGSGPVCGREMARVEVICDAAVYIEHGCIAEIGSSSELCKKYREVSIHVDARGRMVTPGLVDPHTHLVHAGSREDELAQKVAGVPYLDILASGGGILSTVRSTRSATEEELMEQALASLRVMSAFGVTTVEMKSGYGLNWETEYKQLRVARQLAQRQPIQVVSTFLGAHAVPPEYQGRADDYLDTVIDMLRLVVANGLAEFCDVFCETGVFTATQAERLLTAAAAAGLKLKVHADEIESIGGSALAAKLSAVSAEHLLAVTNDDMGRLKEAGVIPVLLPGTAWNLNKRPAPARAMIDEFSLPVAIATDYNPGSCPTENLQLVMAFATHTMKMTPEEVLTACTRNAACAVERGETAGTLDVGRSADIVLWNAVNPEYIVYHFGINHVDKSWVRGRLIVDGGVAIWH